MANKQLGFWGHLKAAVSTLRGFNSSSLYSYNYYGNSFSFGKFSNMVDGVLNNEFVFMAAKVYLNKMKVAPIIVSEVVDEKQYRRYKEYKKNVSDQNCVIKTKEYRTKALQEFQNHPLVDLLDNPNSYQTATEFRACIAAYMKMDIGAFIVKDIPGDDSIRKFPIALHVIPNPSQTVEVIYSGNFRDPIKEFKVTIDAQVFILTPDQVIYIKDWNPLNSYQGMSSLYPGRELILTDKLSRTAQAKVFEHGGSASLISDDSKDNDSRMSPEQIEALTDKIQEKYQGKFGQITTTNGSVKVQKIGDAPIDMEILASRKFSRAAIGPLLGVDGVLIGDKEGGTENNVTAAYKSLVVNTIIPDQIHIAENLEKDLGRYFKERISLDYDTTVYPELQPDLKLMKEVYGTPPLTQNELRALFNYDQLDNHGDVILIPSGLETLDMVVGGVDEIDNVAKSFDGGY